MRKTQTIKLKNEMLLAQGDDAEQARTFGSDEGKIFRFTEMPALKLENWYIRMFNIVHAAANQEEQKNLEELKNNQSAAIAVTSTPAAEKVMDEITGQLKYVDLLNEFLECYEIYLPNTDRYVKLNKDNIDEYVDTFTAIRFLRDKAAKESLQGFI